ncbi:Putative pentatricopeptide repeat-containing protein [Apostasia shenzhenica]|uniref:Pentatricopeptide repeat-containing protein n=1 Tax=Apostasia shenzhenica TaxID=1088818 RepID=A0A2I0AQI2_9ASPA|nr:Putative pentatricopeptide repeat-containing protein [Apostasia shenzhenica]
MATLPCSSPNLHLSSMAPNSGAIPNPSEALIPTASKSTEGRASSLLQSCSSFSHLTQIHAQIIRSSLQQNHFLAAKLVSSSFSLGRHSYASRIFAQLRKPDLFLFNAMIKGFVSAAAHHEALLYYLILLQSGFSPDAFTLPLALKACSKLSAAAVEGRALHGHVVKFGLGFDVFVQTALLDLYGSCGEIADAVKTFDRMPERDVAAWNAMVSACARSGSVSLAEKVFDEMPLRNVSSWTAMIGGFLNSGDPVKAISAFRRMQLDGIQPDKMLIATILSAIAGIGSLSSGRWVSDYMKKNGILLDPFTGTALIDMYSKCGSIRDAMSVFRALRSKNTSCYNAMIFGLAVHGMGEEAIGIFKELERTKMEIDDLTMLAVLTACSHSGLVEEGMRYFRMMREAFSLEPKIKHYGSVIDLLGRAGRLEEAVELVGSIGVDFAVVGALAAACQKHRSTKLADRLAMRMTELSEESSGFLVWRASVHAANGEWEEAAEIRRVMKEKGREKGAGCSLIEVGDKFHWFVAADHTHPRSDEIYSKLDELYDVMKLLGA